MPYLQPTAVKVVDFNSALGTFSGYASVFGNPDANGDVVERGAFDWTLKLARAQKQDNRAMYLWPICWMHDPKHPIGGVTSAREDAKGLYIEGQLDMSTAAGRAAFSGIREGYSTGLSIGYDTTKATRDAQGVRHILGVRLWEVSLITQGFAANEQASVIPESVKSIAPRPAGANGGGARVPLEGTRESAAPATRPPQVEEYRNSDAYRAAFQQWVGDSWLKATKKH